MTLLDVMQLMQSRLGGKRETQFRRTVLETLIYLLWEERNAHLFESRCITMGALIQRVGTRVLAIWHANNHKNVPQPTAFYSWKLRFHWGSTSEANDMEITD